jgi:RHS repeat-associated protein
LLLIRETRGTQTKDYYPLYDGSGHVIALADSNRTLVAEYAYGPFGELIHAKGPMAQINPIRYATKYYDSETGLYYFGQRYLDPVTGQWLNREPLGESESVNLYSYCHNDPVNNVDRLGLATTLVSGEASISTEIPNIYKVCRLLADTSTLNIVDTAVMDLIALPYLEDYVAAHPLLMPDMSREAFLTYLPIAVLNASIAQLDAFADTEGLDAKTQKWIHQISQARSDSAHDWTIISGTAQGLTFIAQPDLIFFKGAAAGLLAIKGLSMADDALRLGLRVEGLAANSAQDVLVLGRGPLSRLESLAAKEGGRVSTIDSNVAKEIFKQNYRDVRSADKIIQYMDNIPTTLEESLKIGGQFSRAEVFMINQRKDLLLKTIRKFETPP